MLSSEPSLRIRLFGCPRVLHAHAGSSYGLGRPLRLLMACLLMQGQRSHHREALAGKIWPKAPQESAARSFRTALWRLRRILEPEGTEKGSYLMVTSNGEVRFNWDGDFSADVVDFENGVKGYEDTVTGLTEPGGIAHLKLALDLYNGELLEGSWDDWVIYERERLRRLYLRGLNIVFKSQIDTGEYDDALRYGRRILALDPLRESTHRDMLRLYALNGQRAEAINQYECLVQDLRQELDVEPADATKSVFRGTLDSAANQLAEISDRESKSEITHVVKDFADCLEEIDNSRKKLRAILTRITDIFASR